MARITTWLWVVVLAVNLWAATRRGDAAGEAMMAGCAFLGTTIPVLLFALVTLVLARGCWRELSESIRLRLWLNVAAVVLLFLVTSLVWEWLSSY